MNVKKKQRKQEVDGWHWAVCLFLMAVLTGTITVVA